MSDNPTQSVIVIAEESLLDVDVAHIRSLSGDSTDFRLLVPTGVDRNVVAEFVEHLAIFDLKEAWEDLTGQNEVAPDVARSDATQVLQESQDALERGDCSVSSARIVDNVMSGIQEELAAAQNVLQVVAVTEQRAVEDTFHTNWPDKAREKFGLPVLHIYRGTSEIGT